MAINMLHEHLDAIRRYLQPHMQFVNCHMVEYLNKDLWNVHISASIRNEIQTVAEVESAIEAFWEFYKAPQTYQNIRSAALIQFLRGCYSHQLVNLPSDVLWDPHQLRNALISKRVLGRFPHDNSVRNLNIKEFMTEKKNHEVEIAANMVAALCSTAEDHQRHSVIDAGDGKGYLSSRLALEYDLNVLGIDANESNTDGALKRSTKLERAWTGLTKRAEDIQNGITPSRRGRRKRCEKPVAEEMPPKTTINKYQRSTNFITPTTDFSELFRQHFPEAPETTVFCLSGLHTCGNLASSCLQIFSDNVAIRTLCNVGCCYHLIDEEFAHNELYVAFDDPSICKSSASATFGFPMSSYLRDNRLAVGRNARMLASQSLNRTVASKEFPGASLFYRTLLETLILTGTEYGRNLEQAHCIQVGRMKNVDRLTFAEYVAKCAKSKNVPDALRLELESMNSNDLDGMLTKYELQRRQMDLFYLLRMTFAPILESVIMLDRLLYLRTDCSIEDAYLVRLFDPIVSPRCVAVIASKAKLNASVEC